MIYDKFPTLIASETEEGLGEETEEETSEEGEETEEELG